MKYKLSLVLFTLFAGYDGVDYRGVDLYDKSKSYVTGTFVFTGVPSAPGTPGANGGGSSNGG